MWVFSLQKKDYTPHLTLKKLVLDDILEKKDCGRKKFGFLWGPAYRIVKKKEKRKYSTPDTEFLFLAEGRLSVVWNKPENKKERTLNLNMKCGYFVDKLFHITSCFVTVQWWVSLLLVPILLFIYFMLFYSIVLSLFCVCFYLCLS